MAKIKVLTPDIYNLISAGEVVDAPVGAVKEVVENSIDAGANRITIEIANGGFEAITITDNGCGMTEEDLELAFIKHATSKLASAKDLEAVQTLGFRGEALPSIAAVSKIKLTTRHNSDDTATSVTVENSVIVSKKYVSANVGTRIEITDLFYNTPARKKFLKQASREATDISKYVAKLILTNPNLEINYILDGKTVYRSKGAGLTEALFAVYGKDCVSNCIPVNYSKNNCRITGFIGAPQYSKANKTYQTLSVNGRYVIDANIAGSVQQAFKPYLMTRQYPFFVLDLEIPYDCVDVNAHPKKTEVRFADRQAICGAFYHAVSDALFPYMRAQKLFGNVSNQDDVSYREQPLTFDKQEYSSKQDNAAKLTEIINSGKYEIMNPAQSEDVIKIEKLTRKEELRRDFEEFADRMEREVTVESARKRLGLNTDPSSEHVSLGTIAAEDVPEPAIAPSIIENEDEADELFARTRILGVAFKTYLILEIDDKVILVDQHAAHERILFDRFMTTKSSDMQPLMFPYIFTVRDEEAQFIDANLENIMAAGVEIEPFGRNTFRITSTATLFSNAKMNEFVDYLLQSVDEFRLDDSRLIVEKIAQKACKAAIKAGYTLNEFEIKNILKDIAEDRVLQCPHGRPITITLTKRQIEKMFKRIV